MKITAKEELLIILQGKCKVKCAEIFTGDFYEEDRVITILKCNYSEEEYLYFLNSLDFLYDNDYGGQELFGIVWLEDNTWLERGEYDGSEWWEYKEVPKIPENLYK